MDDDRGGANASSDGRHVIEDKIFLTSSALAFATASTIRARSMTYVYRRSDEYWDRERSAIDAEVRWRA